MKPKVITHYLMPFRQKDGLANPRHIRVSEGGCYKAGHCLKGIGVLPVPSIFVATIYL